MWWSELYNVVNYTMWWNILCSEIYYVENHTMQWFILCSGLYYVLPPIDRLCGQDNSYKQCSKWFLVYVETVWKCDKVNFNQANIELKWWRKYNWLSFLVFSLQFISVKCPFFIAYNLALPLACSGLWNRVKRKMSSWP